MADKPMIASLLRTQKLGLKRSTKSSLANAAFNKRYDKKTRNKFAKELQSFRKSEYYKNRLNPR